jgi:predicted metalloprotease with PDZ domain
MEHIILLKIQSLIESKVQVFPSYQIPGYLVDQISSILPGFGSKAGSGLIEFDARSEKYLNLFLHAYSHRSIQNKLY